MTMAANRGKTSPASTPGSFAHKLNSAPGAGAGLTPAPASSPVAGQSAPSVLLKDYDDTAGDWHATVAAKRQADEENASYTLRNDLNDRLRSLAIVHGQTVKGAEDVLADAEAFDHGTEDAERYLTYAAQRRREVQVLDELGYGRNPEKTSIAQLRRDIPAGSRIEVQYLRASLGGGLAGPEERTVDKQTDHEMISTRPDGTPVHNQWGKTAAYRDDAGHYIVCDDHDDPYVAYRIVD